jgi:hypothetical protein
MTHLPAHNQAASAVFVTADKSTTVLDLLRCCFGIGVLSVAT